MIRFISWIGNKPSKRIDIGIGRSIEFVQGQVVDIIEAGMTERMALSLLDTGLFKLHGASDPVPFDLEEAENICQCGFVAKNKAGFKAHQRSCA